MPFNSFPLKLVSDCLSDCSSSYRSVFARMTKIWSAAFSPDNDDQSSFNSHFNYKFMRPDSGYQSLSQVFFCDAIQDEIEADATFEEIVDSVDEEAVVGSGSGRVASQPIPIQSSGSRQVRRSRHSVTPSPSSPSATNSSRFNQFDFTSEDSLDVARHPPCYCGCFRGFRSRYEQRLRNLDTFYAVSGAAESQPDVSTGPNHQSPPPDQEALSRPSLPDIISSSLSRNQFELSIQRIGRDLRRISGEFAASMRPKQKTAIRTKETAFSGYLQELPSLITEILSQILGRW